MTTSESNFTQKLENLDNRTRIIPALVETAFGAGRSASSIASDDYAVMNGELNYQGAGYKAWSS